MDKLQADKLTEIRTFHKDDEEFLRKYPTTRALQAHEHISYLLQLVETQAQALEEAKDTVEGLYQIIQREDLTSTDMKEAEVAYDRFSGVLTQV